MSHGSFGSWIIRTKHVIWCGSHGSAALLICRYSTEGVDVPRLHKRELAEILHLLPEAKHCRPETEPQGRSESLFLCALGFEERCLTLPARLAASGYRADHAIYLQYETNSGDNESRLPSLLTALNVISDDVQKFRYRSEERRVGKEWRS